MPALNIILVVIDDLGTGKEKSGRIRISVGKDLGFCFASLVVVMGSESDFNDLDKMVGVVVHGFSSKEREFRNFINTQYYLCY